MTGDVAELVNEAWPFVSAAVGGYGAAVLKASEDSAAGATVSCGRRILRRIFGGGEPPEALAELATDPGDADLQAALRVVMRKVLADEGSIAGSVRELLAEAAAAGTNGNGISNVVSNSTIYGSIVQADTIEGNITFG
jgi:hypothetical protein